MQEGSSTIKFWTFITAEVRKNIIWEYISAYFYSISLKNFQSFLKLENLNCFKLLCIILEYFSTYRET